MSSKRDIELFMADFYEYIDDFNGMIDAMNNVIDIDPNLNFYEQMLLIKGYKKKYKSYEKALDSINMNLEKEQQNENSQFVDYLQTYKKKVLNELENFCYETIGIIDFKLIPFTKDYEIVLLYETCKGNFYRYLCSYISNDIKTEIICKANQCYEKCRNIVENGVKTSSYSYRYFYLCYTIFLYEILDKKIEAIKLAIKTVNICTNYTITFDEEYSIELGVLYIIKSHIILWKEQMGIDDEELYEYNDT